MLHKDFENINSDTQRISLGKKKNIKMYKEFSFHIMFMM